MTPVVVGVDAGGSKLAVRIETMAGSRVADAVFPAADWAASPVAPAAAWLLDHIGKVVPAGRSITAIGVGAQGCDSRAHCDALAAAMGPGAVVVNDGALLVPAAGLHDGIGVIAGTGAIAVGQDKAGEPLFAGGWGWVLGDEAGAPGLVRLATVAALTAHDEGAPDDGLLAELQHAFAVRSPEALARAVNDEPTPESWGRHAPAVFAAADRGSALAAGVVYAGADHLATLVRRLLDRGAVGECVVAAGGVITHQPRLERAFRDRIAARHPQLSVTLLEDEPVAGAVVLARRRVRAS